MTGNDNDASTSLLADTRELLTVAWRLDRRRLLLQFVFLTISGLVGGVSLLLLVPIVNSIADPSSRLVLPLGANLNLNSVPLPALLGAFVVLSAVSALITRAGTINSSRLQQRIVDHLRQEAFEAILAARWEFVVQQKRSAMMEIVTSGASRSGQAFYQLVQFSVSAVLLVATACVAFVVSPPVTLVALVGMAVLAAAQSTAIRPAYRMGTLFGQRNRHLQSVMLDSMDSLRLVRAHAAGAIWAERLSGAFSDTREIQVANVRRQSTVSALSSIGLAIAAATLVLVSVWFGVDPAGIVVLLLLVARMAGTTQRVVSSGAMLANSLPGVRDLSELTAAARDAIEVPPSAISTRSALNTDAPLMMFRHVTYRYPGSDNGVTDISFDVPTGRVTVLTGHSGAGKSTLADLSLGLLTPQSGDIVVAGEPLTPADLSWWRSHVAYVPQETVLVPGTLRENLVWSAPADVTDADCWQALERAAASFATDLPQGLDTTLGDRGLRLSGGERQRVAIARALLRSPSLLVLDEATSALDDVTEAAILDLMSSLAPTVTLLVIAHRRSTVDAADHVIELAHGHVIDDRSIA